MIEFGMVRAFRIRTIILGQSIFCTASRKLNLSASHHVGFVNTKQSSSSAAFVLDAQTQTFLGGPKMQFTARRLALKLTESSTNYLDRQFDNSSSDYLYTDADGIDVEGTYEEELDSEIEAPSHSHQLHKALYQAVQSALKSIDKKTSSLQKELEKAQSLEETMSRANLIVSNLYRLTPGISSIEVEDWENDGKLVQLTLNTKDYMSAQEESDALFALARKMKRGSVVVKELLVTSLEAQEILKDGLNSLSGSESVQDDVSFHHIREQLQLDESALVLIQEKLERSSKKTGFRSPSLESLTGAGHPGINAEAKRRKVQPNNQKSPRYKPNPRELISPSGHKVLVGRNRRDNEAICFQLSRPTDVWMHSRGCPGAHVLLCVRRGSPEVTEDDLQFAANLAIFYSDARTERKAAVTTAEPKHITKPRGAPPGAVSLRKEGNTLMGRPDLVSEDLKVAREESGGAWDEMGYKKDGTRSRNKKRTATVEKAMREKKRLEANAKNKRKARKDGQDFY